MTNNILENINRGKQSVPFFINKKQFPGWEPFAAIFADQHFILSVAVSLTQPDSDAVTVKHMLAQLPGSRAVPCLTGLDSRQKDGLRD